MHSNYLVIDFFNKQLVDLKKNNIDEYKQKSEMLIESVLGIEKSDLYLNDNFIPHQHLEHLKESFSLLLKDVPVQHIIGKTYFYEHEFFTPPGVFIPRPETELIIDCIQNDFGATEKKTVLDIGCGSGCIGITIASLYKNFDVKSIDISNQAIDIANKNAQHLNIPNVEIIKQDIFEMPIKKFDIIVSNPPYLGIEEISQLDPSVKNHDPLKALSDQEDGLKFYKYFINNLSILIEKEGSMYFEIPKSIITNQIIDMIHNNSNIDSIFFKDLEGNKRVIKVFFK
ncbi:MAG: peptide chain release factor N(5)-glutamine methyltransferase [Candidatus Marinimicrobia bacterium]|jgi:release factor glutamine methyltransferase|nr:peptide chain release factor N(5)-glutamine methyltransferase [Gammaproteobacteria bacterium]MBT3727915.1 peptide chain release factor N(5)-glutamine methyltransferase [Candidatus Neomarinimicrobiota bacterium]MBT3943918.1 peptide chain release factor N(5)-glutamine methyltransferase [Candidatus Neomarinimicrobiota bacterium]MBT4111886.1 peptide chain release factor N(5)-glutamine methyltransferase [Candidatus Neomarinimicrobiota bacterium]MBT4316799.1 peptide chain release factor N(5)-gluta